MFRSFEYMSDAQRYLRKSQVAKPAIAHCSLSIPVTVCVLNALYGIQAAERHSVRTSGCRAAPMYNTLSILCASMQTARDCR